MGVETIIAKIKKDADEDILCIIEEAKGEVRRILADADLAAGEEFKKIIAEGELEIKAKTAGILSQARMDSQRVIREEKERGISICFSEVEKNLSYIKQSPEYKTILKNLVMEGINELDADEITIISLDNDREVIFNFIPELCEKGKVITAGHECAVTIGGVILKSKSGHATLDNTFEARLKRQKNTLMFDASKILYGGV